MHQRLCKSLASMPVIWNRPYVRGRTYVVVRRWPTATGPVHQRLCKSLASIPVGLIHAVRTWSHVSGQRPAALCTSGSARVWLRCQYLEQAVCTWSYVGGQRPVALCTSDLARAWHRCRCTWNRPYVRGRTYVLVCRWPAASGPVLQRPCKSLASMPVHVEQAVCTWAYVGGQRPVALCNSGSAKAWPRSWCSGTGRMYVVVRRWPRATGPVHQPLCRSLALILVNLEQIVRM